MVTYGITIVLIAVVWSIFIFNPGAEIAVVASIVTAALLKDKIG